MRRVPLSPELAAEPRLTREKGAGLKRFFIVGPLVVLLAGVPGLLLGSEPTVVEVMQPMDVENFIRLSRVTYMGYYDDQNGWSNLGSHADVHPEHRPDVRRGTQPQSGRRCRAKPSDEAVMREAARLERGDVGEVAR